MLTTPATTKTHRTCVSVSLLALTLAACGGENEGAPGSTPNDSVECGGHGHLHDDHCDCDAGYEPDPNDDTNCIESGGHNEPGPMLQRLAVSDTEAGQVTILNLNDGSIAGTLTMSAPARLVATESGRFAGAVQMDANRVDFIDSGLGLEEHGDHVDPVTTDPRLLDYSLMGTDVGSEDPVHFVSHSGYVTIHFDGVWDDVAADHVPAKNIILPEEQLLRAAPEPALVLDSAPQHGVSVVTESGHLIMTEPSLDREVSTLPSGVAVRDMSTGSVLQTFNGGDFQTSCWGLHGEAIVGSTVLFGCHQELDGGALVVSWSDATQQFESSKIEYPGYPMAPNRTSIVASHPDSPYMVGQWGTFSFPDNFYDGLVRISLTASEITEADTIDLGSVYCSFGFERAEGKLVAALTRNGRFHVVDVEQWTLLGDIALVANLEAEDACAGALTMGDGVAYVSEAATSSVFEVDLTSLEVIRTISVEGSPGGMALFGMFGIPGKPTH